MGTEDSMEAVAAEATVVGALEAAARLAAMWEEACAVVAGDCLVAMAVRWVERDAEGAEAMEAGQRAGVAGEEEVMVVAAVAVGAAEVPVGVAMAGRMAVAMVGGAKGA